MKLSQKILITLGIFALIYFGIEKMMIHLSVLAGIFLTTTFLQVRKRLPKKSHEFVISKDELKKLRAEGPPQS